MLQLNFKLPVASCWWIFIIHIYLLLMFFTFLFHFIFFSLAVGGVDKVWMVPGNFWKYFNKVLKFNVHQKLQSTPKTLKLPTSCNCNEGFDYKNKFTIFINFVTVKKIQGGKHK